MTRLPIVTQTGIRSFRACPRLFHHRYNLGYQTVQTSQALVFGKAWDRLMRAWWEPSCQDHNQRREMALSGWNCLALDPFEKQKLLVLLYGYDEFWKASKLRPMSTGLQFSIDMSQEGAGSTFMGELDAMAIDEHGRHWIVEHKTSSEDITPGSNYWQRLTLDPQVSAYYAGARSLGYDPVGCVYDVTKKIGLRPLQANKQRKEAETPEDYRDRCLKELIANPEAYFERKEIVRLERDEQEASEDFLGTIQAIEDSRRHGRHPRNPDSCMRYGRLCEYFGVCTGTASLDDPLLFKKLDNVHPELRLDHAGV